MENDRGMEETWTDWDSGGRGTQIGMFVGLAVGVGILAFILRRVFAPKPSPVEETRDQLMQRASWRLTEIKSKRAWRRDEH